MGVPNAFLSTAKDIPSVTMTAPYKKSTRLPSGNKRPLDNRDVSSKSWECDWDQEVKTNPELPQFVDTLEIVNPLQPRYAFFGG